MIFLTMLAIFFAKIAHVSLGTVRIIYLTRGQSKIAALIGFFEAIIYIGALSMVLANIESWPNIIVYGLGFGAGNFVGSWIEEKIAVGYVMVQIVTGRDGGTLDESLRELGYGVTSMPCYGKEGSCRTNLQVLLKRKEVPNLLNKMKQYDPNAFISIYDTRKIMGGYFARMKGK